jgi:signal transduction histidine kinase
VPLTVISGTVELMRLRAPDLAPRDEQALQDVLGEVERLRRLTQDFLDLAADKPLVLSRLDLAEVLDEAARGAEASFPQIRVRRAIERLPALDADAGRLRQVFANLLANAAQAQGQGELVLSAQADGASVRVVVRDQGPGVPRELRARLFDPFVTGKETGTGLGLAISRRMVERHGGSLSLLEEAGTGAAFEVRLPAAR